MTDGTQALVNNVANALGGTIIKVRYIDMIKPTEVNDADADEIIDRIVSGLRELGEEDECI